MRPEVKTLMRTDYLSFLPRAFAELHGGAKLEMTWVIEAIAHALDRCLFGGRTQQIITMPPRSLKSLSVSVIYTAWLLGRDPSNKILFLTYSDDLSRRHSADARRLMESDFYREAFPGTRLVKATEAILETSKGGFRHSTSFGGTVTGLGGDWIIIDDPSKAEDALSKPALEKASQFFSNTLSTRLNDPVKGRIVLVMQRLHEADLAGYLIEEGGWDLLTLPAIAEENAQIPIGDGVYHSRRKGDLLDPKRLPQWYLDKKQRQLGSHGFQAQYQQAPLSAEGNVIKRDWISYYKSAPDLSSGRIIQSLDTAQKTNPTNDYSVLTTWLKVDERSYLLDVFRDRLDFPNLRQRIITEHDRYRPERLLIEEGASGTALIQDLKAQRPEVCSVGIKAKEPKDVRIGAASALFENRQVLFPEQAPWLDACMAEVLGYPSAKHDDVIDSISQYLNWVRSQTTEIFNFDFWHNDADSRVPDPEEILDFFQRNIR